MKQLKDYLYLYRGCSILMPDNTPATLTGADADMAWFASDEHYQSGFCSIASPLFGKPILRPLSDMSGNEEVEYLKLQAQNSNLSNIQRSAESTKWFLSKHFDLFGLIEDGLAIDKTSNTPLPVTT